ETLRGLLPAVAGHVVGGLIARRDGYAVPLRTTQAFGRAATAAGAEILEGVRVSSAERLDGRWIVKSRDADTYAAPYLVNAAGAWGGRLARAVGEAIPLGFNAFQMLLTDSLPPFLTPVVGAAGRPLSFKQSESGHVMIGGGHKGLADLDTGQVRLDVPRLAYSARTALDLFPILRDARIVHAWAGIEGVTPDELPVIGRSAVADGLVHAFGFSGHGFALAPVIGDIVADLLLDGRTRFPIEPFAADRFGRVPLSSSLRPALPQPAG
ncbi:MAG: FAD-binding oxidoreductase, partial [Microvirga sp.]